MSDDANTDALVNNSMIAKPAMAEHQYQMKISRAKDAPVKTKEEKAAEHSIYEIVQEIKNFENDLTQDEEAFMAIIGGPSGSAIFLNGIIPLGLDKVVFVGQNQQGKKARLIQHVSQINIMLQSMPIKAEAAPRRFGIGFHASLEDNDESAQPAEDTADHVKTSPKKTGKKSKKAKK